MLQIDYPTAVRLVITYVTMGAWVTTVSLLTGRYGGRLGGFLIGIPSAVGLAFFFTGLFVSIQVVVSATNDFPIFMSLICLFLVSFGYLAKKGFWTGLLGALLVWFVASLSVFFSGLNDFTISLLGSIAVTVVLYSVFRLRLKPRKPPPGATTGDSWKLRFLRFIIGGTVVTVAVTFSQLQLPVLTALSISFPSLTIPTLIGVRMNSRSEGTEHARGMTMSMMVSIMVMLLPFCTAVRYLYPLLGLWYGTVASYAVAIVIGLLYYFGAERYLVPSFD